MKNQSEQKQPPWDTAGGRDWLASFDSWRQMRRLILGTLQLDPKKHVHEIRAAAALVIMFCRENLWPISEGKSIDPILELAARQLSHVKQLYEGKSKVDPSLLSSKSYRNLLKSLDQEIRILETRLADPKPQTANQPPCSWGNFWTE